MVCRMHAATSAHGLQKYWIYVSGMHIECASSMSLCVSVYGMDLCAVCRQRLFVLGFCDFSLFFSVVVAGRL